MFTPLEIFKAYDDDTYRATFELSHDNFIVVKLFPDNHWTVKYWHGDYKRTISKWNMSRVTDPEFDFASIFIEAEKKIETVAAILQQHLK